MIVVRTSQSESPRQSAAAEHSIDYKGSLSISTLHQTASSPTAKQVAIMADEETPHPFTSYNKPPKQTTTLIGNWVEEQALKDATGHSRYEPWVGQEEPTSIYSTRQDQGMAALHTHPRVIEHIQQTAPENWRSMYGASYTTKLGPGKAAEVIDYKLASTLGPRARLELEAMKAIAADLPPEAHSSIICQAAPTDMETTYGADFIAKDLTANSIGARCMRDHDGRPAVRDPTFLAETQLVPRHMGDRLFGESARLAGASQTSLLPPGGDVYTDPPITIYTEAVATRRYGGNIAGTRAIAGTQPFAKYTNFSKPMAEYNKVVVDE